MQNCVDSLYVWTVWLCFDKFDRFLIETILSQFKPFVYKTILPNGTVEYSGYCIDLLKHIAENLSFDYTIYDKDEIGTMNDNGQWSGVIGELTEGVSCIIVC